MTRLSLPEFTPDDEKGGARSHLWSVWAAPLVVLFGLWIWQAFAYGGFMPHQWLPAALIVGLFGLVISSAVAYPRRPRQLSLVVFALFIVYAIWIGCSAIWAGSTSRVWLETARSGMLVVVFGLALVFLTDAGARRWFRYLLMGGVLFLLAASIIKLWTTGNIANLFVEDRFFFPVTYPNNAAALFLVCFWPLIWLAAGPEERAPVRGLALGLATGSLGLAMMTQSRGALWSLGISVVLAFILSPARLRTLLYLAAPILLLVYEFPVLNSYWTDGPAAVGGGPAARTLLIATIATAFIGMILALLERWIKVPGKAKVIIGSIVFVAMMGGAIFGAITLTKDAGGPTGWVSQTWKEFTGQKAPDVSESETGSRLLMASSSGRVDIWKVAWRGFSEDPVLGAGADNFAFQHNLLRETDGKNPLHAHSIGLQVLGETGIIGGVIIFGAMALALGGILWPRTMAGWRRARSVWLRPPKIPKRAKTVGEADPQADSRSVAEGKKEPFGARWGARPIEYGWPIALLSGVLYWLIHAGVDWLWQMSGVALPMLLLLAAALAEVDARADTLWPRLNRLLRLKSRDPVPATGPAADSVASAETADDRPLSTLDPTVGGPDPIVQRRHQPDKVFRARRSDRHESRRLKREKRRRRAAHLQPPGLLSHGFRMLLLVFSLAVLVMAGLSYLAIQYQDSALALARQDAARAADRAGAARWLQPSSPGPYETQAIIYHIAALEAAGALAVDRAGAVLDDLALALDSLDRAADIEQVDWSLHYQAGVAAVNLALATAYALDHDPDFVYAEWDTKVPGLEDWKTSLGPASPPSPPGEAEGSLADDTSSKVAAAELRDMGFSELLAVATDHLVAASDRNPLESEIATAMQLVDHLRRSQIP